MEARRSLFEHGKPMSKNARKNPKTTANALFSAQVRYSRLQISETPTRTYTTQKMNFSANIIRLRNKLENINRFLIIDISDY